MIVFEGLDASGKETQTRLLKKKLESMNHKVETIDFPNYTSKIGKMIKQYLQEKQEFNKYAVGLLYAADRYDQSDKINSWLSEGKDVICDRYFYSNIAYQGTRMPIDWLITLDSKLPKPDCVIYLDISISEIRKRKNPEDKHEKDISYLENVKSIYDRIISDELHVDDVKWHKINAMKPVSEVHEDVMSVVSKCMKNT